MEKIFENYRRRLNSTELTFKRYMLQNINWESRMIGIVGPRGVGKTTMMLQRIKEGLDLEKSLYISVDQMYFAKNTLVEVAEYFVKMGGTHLFVDEVHKYPNWSQELKELYDNYPELHVVFSGSSILDIYKSAGDLSRRAPMYVMQGLSFREYLGMFHGVDLPVFSLEQVLANRVDIGIEHMLPYFKDYLKRGYYPFGKDPDFDMELVQVVNMTMETDIPQYARLNISVSKKLQRLMMVVAESVPFKPQMTTLSNLSEVSRNDVADYLYYMERAGLLAQLRDNTQGVRGLGKVNKIYLDNPNLAYVLAEKEPNIGNLRETFFYNQTRVVADVKSSSLADFDIDGRTFEVGGHSKGKRQIEKATDGYVVKDDIEYGHANIIPLWAFGLLY